MMILASMCEVEALGETADPAVLLGDGQAEEAQLLELAHLRFGEYGGPVDRSAVQPLARPGTERFEDQAQRLARLAVLPGVGEYQTSLQPAAEQRVLETRGRRRAGSGFA